MPNIVRRESAIERLTQSLAATGTQSLSGLAQSIREERTGRFLLLDCSSSMGSKTRSGKTAFECLRDVVRDVQAAVPNVRTICFPDGSIGGSRVAEKPLPDSPYGNTPLAEAIDLAASLGASHVVVISDGEPSDARAALDSARRFGGKIDVFFTGDPGSYGERFLRDLANTSGGGFVSDRDMLGGGKQRELVGKVTLALTAGRK